ncbi:MAG: amidinotransferase [Bacteroidales bacterium]|nr:amidinotransferase [Bacteroidales bacterium]
MSHITKLLMVRPVRFGYNIQTAASNHFQKFIQGRDPQASALEEFDRMVCSLKEYDIPVIVVEDTPEPETCDSIFPNNWFSTHEDGTLVLYPMLAPNRREERDPRVIKTIMEAAGTKNVLDLSGWEEQGEFLEGTGSLVLDRKSMVAYACRSPRTSEAVLNEFCNGLGYRPIVFDAVDNSGSPVYHTNVVMSIGESFAILCKDVILSPEELSEVESCLSEAGKKVVGISYGQMCHFAGNILEVKNLRGEKFVVMSQTARDILTEDQLAVIGENSTIIPVDIPCIENIGGGSARCMMAEVICCQ